MGPHWRHVANTMNQSLLILLLFNVARVFDISFDIRSRVFSKYLDRKRKERKSASVRYLNEILLAAAAAAAECVISPFLPVVGSMFSGVTQYWSIWRVRLRQAFNTAQRRGAEKYRHFLFIYYHSRSSKTHTNKHTKPDTLPQSTNIYTYYYY